MNILITINNSYAPYAATMLQSLVEHNTDIHFNAYIISTDISEENKRLISSISNYYKNTNGGINTIFPEIKSDLLDEIRNIVPHLAQPFNISFILRLYAPRILQDDIDKILYLDVDTVIASSLKELDAITFDNETALAAVKDLVRYDDYARLGIDETKHVYFNSGVMLINLSYWRKNNTGDKCLKLLVEHSKEYKFPDQDALNVVCEGKVHYLHPQYNCLTFFFARREFLKTRIRKDEFENVIDAAKKPAIVHYTWPSKPWHKGGFVPKRELWKQALQKTEYKNIKIQYKDGIKGFIRHAIKTAAIYALPLIGLNSKYDIYHKLRYKHIYYASLILYYGFAQWLPNFDSPFFGKLSNRIRVFCIKNIFEYVGKRVNIGRKARFGNGRNIYIDSRSNIGANCYIPSNTIIGKDVMMGPNCFFFSSFTHNIDNVEKPMIEQGFKIIKGNTEIEDDVWIGRDVLFMPCLKICAHSVIGARSVVTKNVPERVIVAGNPARIVKERKQK